LKKIGISLTVKTLSDSEFAQTFSKPHKADPVHYTYMNNNTPDPGGMPNLVLTTAQTGISQNNFADYSKAEVDSLVKTADSTTDPAKRFATYSRLLEVVGDDVPYVPLYAGDINIAISKGFEWPAFNAYSTDHTPFIMQINPK